MPIRAKIAISEPGAGPKRRYFSLRLKQSLSIEPTEYRSPHKLLVISNIQGDFHIFRDLLISAGIIDKKYHWIFGDGHLVIAGDCFGENEMGTECLWLIYALEEKAKRQGGYVHFILGKNEINNLNGSWQRLQPRYANGKRTSKAPYVVLYDGNRELRRWLQTKNIVEKIGSVLVCYTDISIEVPLLDLPLMQINNMARQYYYKTDELRSKNIVATVLHSKSLSIISNPYSQPEIVRIDNDLVYQKFTTRRATDVTYIFANNENTKVDQVDNLNRIKALLIKDNQLYPIDIA